MNRKIAALAAAMLIGGATGGSVLAGGPTVPSLTGCLANKDATLIKVKLGDAPSSPCSTGQTLVHLSGGDITSVAVGPGLTGGGTNGDLTIGLDGSFTLPQDCQAGDIVEKASSGWTCGTDDDTTYSAGNGLNLSAGNAFSLEPDNLVINGESCTTGKLVSGIDSSGHITCAAPPAGGGLPHGWFKLGGAMNFGGTVDAVALDLPAGSYYVTANVVLIGRDADTGSSADCWVGAHVIEFGIEAGEDVELAGTVGGMISHAGGPVALKCNEHAPDVDLISSSIFAIQLSGIN